MKNGDDDEAQGTRHNQNTNTSFLGLPPLYLYTPRVEHKTTQGLGSDSRATLVAPSPTAPTAMPSSSGRSSPDPEKRGYNSSSSLLPERNEEGGSGDREAGQRPPPREEGRSHLDNNASPRGDTADHGATEGHRGSRKGGGSGGGDDGLLPSATAIPQRFSCSRCAKCKHQSKGAFYCRVILLHLFAPSWEDLDQETAWDIPRGFLKWLRREGPLEGCEVRQNKLPIGVFSCCTSDPPLDRVAVRFFG